MSAKWSDLAADANVLDTDLFCIARPPDNFTVSILDMLYRTGDAKVFGANGSSLTFDVSGGVTLDVVSGQSFLINVPDAGTLSFTAGGALVWVGVAGSTVGIQANGGSFAINSLGAPFLAAAPGQIVGIEYNPAGPGNWSGVPIELIPAVDRLAAAVAGLLGGPIP